MSQVIYVHSSRVPLGFMLTKEVAADWKAVTQCPD